MPSLGGSIFTHNCVKFDYCIAESVASLCAVCDDVVVLDAESDDTTVDVLMECKKKYANLRVFTDGKWECASNYDRLAILANEAKSKLNTDWHFMLQADEVIHEDSFASIRQAIEHPKSRSFFCRRLNLFGDCNHYLRFDLPQDRKPCSDIIIRLAHLNYPAVGDAESLGVDPAFISRRYQELIHIFHYGLVRRDANFIKKVIDMQSWFSGPGSQPDHRVVEMDKKGDNKFEWERLKERSDLARIFKPHPIYSKEWAEIRQAEKPFPIND